MTQDLPEQGERVLLLHRMAAELAIVAPVDIGTMFRSPGLRWNGKIVAFLGHEDRLIVKLPAERGAHLIQLSAAEPVEMRGRRMKEWFGIPAADDDEQSTFERWLPIARESLAFVMQTMAG